MPSRIQAEVREFMSRAWDDEFGYTAPNTKRYDHQWLWDSCFHAISWAALGDSRCVREMESLFSKMLPSGFVANTTYHHLPRLGFLQWRNARLGISDITQPPMYGHALRVLHDAGHDISHLLEPASRAMNYLFEQRMDPQAQLIKIVHPWETGCDDIARWDSWTHGGYRRKKWNVIKYVMARRIRLDHHASVANPMFEVCSAGFNALVAYNALELSSLTNDSHLQRRAELLIAQLEKQWNPATACWNDVPLGRKSRPSRTAPTLDALLPLLVTKNPEHIRRGFAALSDPEMYRGPYGLRVVPKSDPTYASNGYWRGSTWAQMVYLCWKAAEIHHQSNAMDYARLLVKGASASGYAEHWNPETGEGRGAIPLGFSSLAAVADVALAAAPPARTPRAAGQGLDGAA